MWTKSASVSKFPLAWDESLSFVRAQNDSRLYGYNDWKLPNRRELFSLISLDAINPSLPANHPFTDIFNGYYWTSTSCARLPDQAWYIHLGGARVFKGMKYNSYMVWPVRTTDINGTGTSQTGQRHCYDAKGNTIDCLNSGQDGEYRAGKQPPGDRFRNTGDVVTDRATGLTWFQNADCNPGMLDWQSAFDAVTHLNRESTCGFDDWRLPHIFELESLIDLGLHSPALPVDHPFSNIREFYWSSTTSWYDPDYAWSLYLRDGIIGVGYKRLPEFYLWPVRG